MKVQHGLVHIEEEREREEEECAHLADRSDFTLWALKIKFIIGKNMEKNSDRGQICSKFLS